MDKYFDTFRISRLIFQRALAGVYLTAFISALKQFPVLLGEKGLLPVADFLRQVPFKEAPSLFYLGYSDRLFMVLAWAGILISITLILGLFDKMSWFVSACVWLVIWAVYLSIVNVGQVFYGFGWESMLLEAGFFSAFLGSQKIAASIVPVLILRWMLFRVELGAGLIKIRGDECWRDLTCLVYHYETQPLPNPLSWFFHHLPQWLHRASVLFSHFVQLVVPFGLFAPKRVAAVSGALIILHQLILIVNGNYSWLNWITVMLSLMAFGDSIWNHLFTVSFIENTRSIFYSGMMYVLAVAAIFLSIQPTRNFFAKQQLMNYNYNPLHLVGSYGAFGSVTKQRFEMVIEGTLAETISPEAEWKEYEFKGKPGDIMRQPPQVAPYHLRLDWMMWFLPFTVQVTPQGVYKGGYQVWFLRFMRKLLEGDASTLKLLRSSPFHDICPHFIRVRFYLYRFTTTQERKATGAWWQRILIDDYLPPASLVELSRF